MEETSELSVIRHSTSHLLAQAVKRLYPDAKLGIGPDIDTGFYYDFEFAEPLSDDDLPKIEKLMKKLAKNNVPFVRQEKSKAESKKMLKEMQEPYKLELVEELEDGTISFYQHEEFIDLCAGPHVKSTKEIKAFKLLKVAGAYWRGDEKNKMLTRIYGTAFATQEELDEFLHLQEEALKRDHRKLGKELDLFSFHEEGPGFPFFHDKGMRVWNKLIGFWREEHAKYNYEEIKTPMILSRALWEQSGHWENYKENMYTSMIDEQDFAIKPMNCPGGMLLYKEGLHSYRDLPMRVGEIGLVHRHEKSGVLSGLFRVRCFHQDDAHIFMREDQIKDEILNVLNLTEKMYAAFGLNYHLELSTRPEKSIGSDEAWNSSEKALEAALKATGKKYLVNEGDGAFYGPKIDVHIQDALGRTWQCGTIQLDMNLPERFDLSYIGEDGKKHRPVMIHRVVYGSMERFFGILVEHYGGKFPAWLAPVQVKVLTITDAQKSFASKVKDELAAAGVAVEIDDRAEKIGLKIREATLQKVPYMLVVGDKEVKAKSVAVRSRNAGDQGVKTMPAFKKKILKEIADKK